MLKKAHVKYDGTDVPLAVDYGDLQTLEANFAAAHKQRYGFVAPEKALIVESLSVEAVGAAGSAEDPVYPEEKNAAPPKPVDQVALFTAGASQHAPVYDRATLKPGQAVEGPAVIVEETATTMVEPGWRARLDRRRYLVLERAVPRPRRRAAGTNVDPVMLEVFNNLFMAIAEQMGVALQNTAYSVNIKERLDFSCALFDRQGSLIANAPHIPVHLGSMGESVETVIRARGHKADGRGMKPGDVYVLNAPYNGGTHLPDVTVITPVFAEEDKAGTGEVLFYVASRGHHADIGGITPGSMPPFSKTIEEEGVLIDDFLLVDAGRFREAEIVALLRSGKYPARNPAQNVADLKAQIAASEKGVQELHRMVRHFGLEMVEAYMRHVQDNAEEAVRRVLGNLKDGEFSYAMDDGAVVHVKISVDRKARQATIDFAGTSPVLPNNFNAPTAVCKAAVLYVFRTLVEDEIPMNGGCLKPLDIRIPEGSMLKPALSRGGGGGQCRNLAMRHRRALRRARVDGGGPGHMNNFTFGNTRYQYYETICGGSGAGPGFDGTSAVHTDEQLHLRQRALPVLRDDLRRLGRRARLRRHEPPSTPI